MMTRRGQWKMGIIDSLFVGKGGQVRGVNIRISSKGKPEFCSRPLQKVYPLEIACCNDSNKKERNAESKDGNTELRKEGIGRIVNEENIELESPRALRQRPTRAAARDAQWKSRLMLDHC